MELERMSSPNRAQTERRSARRSEPPYITEEGFVLVDRRNTDDHRAEQREPVVADYGQFDLMIAYSMA